MQRFQFFENDALLLQVPLSVNIADGEKVFLGDYKGAKADILCRDIATRLETNARGMMKEETG